MIFVVPLIQNKINYKNWLNKNLIKETKIIFEPLYKRELLPKEVTEISNNLVSLVKLVNKFRWKLKYGKDITIYGSIL